MKYWRYCIHRFKQREQDYGGWSPVLTQRVERGGGPRHMIERGVGPAAEKSRRRGGHQRKFCSGAPVWTKIGNAPCAAGENFGLQRINFTESIDFG